MTETRPATGSERLRRAYERAVFTTPPARLERFTRAILEHIPRDRALRVLDVGCGTGEQLFHLAQAHPQLEGRGVDVSKESVAIAELERAQRPEGARLRFLAQDYLTWERDAAFDAIISYSVLHCVPGKTEALLAKLARDLAPGGVLVNCMPIESRSNALVLLGRRLCRFVRGRWIEGLAFFVARCLYRGLDPGLIRERILYLYFVPERYEGARFQAAARDAGLEVVHERAEPRASFAQLRHRLVVYRKRA